MKMYRVKLSKGNTAKANQKKKGYLANFGTIAEYTRGEAIKKARMFGGKIEIAPAKPKGIESVFNRVSMIQIPENALLDDVVRVLRKREAFTDTDNELNERIFTGDVFEAILGENSHPCNVSMFKIKDKKVLAQLTELARLVDSEYVQITQI